MAGIAARRQGAGGVMFQRPKWDLSDEMRPILGPDEFDPSNEDGDGDPSDDGESGEDGTPSDKKDDKGEEGGSDGDQDGEGEGEGEGDGDGDEGEGGSDPKGDSPPRGEDKNDRKGSDKGNPGRSPSTPDPYPYGRGEAPRIQGRGTPEGKAGDKPDVKMRVLQKKNVYRQEFDSFEQFVRQAELVPHFDGNDSRTDPPRDDWDFNVGFDGAVKLGHEGWIEGAKQVSAQLDVLDVRGRKAEPELVFARVGPGTLHPGRYMQGHPVPMMVWKDGDRARDGAGEVLTVFANISASAGFSAAGYMQKGVLICALVDLLERFNYRVELIVGMATSRTTTAENVITLKKPGDALNMDRVAFAIAHPSCLRRLGFAVWEMMPGNIRDAVDIRRGKGYGRPTSIKWENAIVIEGGDIAVASTLTGQRQWLSQQLAAQGIIWEPEPE